MHTQTQLSFARPPHVSEVASTESTAMEGGEQVPHAHAPASNDTCTPTTSTISSRAWRKAELVKMECEYERRRQRLALMEKELQYAQVHPPHTTNGPLIHHDRSLCGVAEAQAGEKTDSSRSFVGTPAVSFGPEVAATATADKYTAATADADTASGDSPSIMIHHASTSPKANTTQAVAAGTAPSLDETASCAILIER